MKFRLIAMLLTGFALAIALLWATQFARDTGESGAPSATPKQQADRPIAIRPAVFSNVSEGIKGAALGELRISGEAEALATLVLSQGGKRLGEAKVDKDGTWSAVLPINPRETQAIDLILLLEDGTRVRSDETLFRIPQVEGDSGAQDSPAIVMPSTPFNLPTLILLTTPGGPSKVFKSPFGGMPVEGPISLGPIDYDDSGGAVFRGTSERAGRVRLYANGAVIGDAPVQADGQWFYIIAETLPRGSYDIVVALMDGTEEVSRITVPFEKMAFAQSKEPGGGLYVSYGKKSWQVRRDLIGGGAQYSALFAPKP